MGYIIKNTNIEFFVRDSGIGIDPSLHEKIFEPFRQAEINTRIHDGAGLGLTIAKAQAEILGGYIHLESQLHKGSCFYLTLPYKRNGD